MPTARDRSPASLDPADRGVRILHLEDSDIDADLTRAFLDRSQIKADIDRCQTQDEFTACLTQNTYDVILSDYHLPAFDGLRALQLASELCPHTPFIFLSGALGEEVAIEMLKKGATDYVLKQRMSRLVPAVSRALAQAQERQARLAAESEREAMLLREQAARRDAETASRIKDEFLAVASHELRTPLNAILGWATILQGTADPNDIREGLAVIQRNAKHQAQLIEDILDVSRMIAGRLRITVRPCDMATIVRRANETLQPAAEAKGVRVEQRLDEAVLISCDADRLEQVVWNLMSNAIKFTPQGGKIEVCLQSAASQARLTITDSGRGISPEFLPFVFDRFRQADGTTTRRHGGLGLGLAIVRNIIELHGGTVAASSDGIGRGATFAVELPLLAPASPAASVESAAKLSTKSGHCQPNMIGLRVLVVDDDPDARRLMRAMLEWCEAHVVTAASVSEAIALLAAEPPDILLSDIGMPEEDGNSLLQRLRAGKVNDAVRRLPAIALTAFTRGEDRAKAMACGFDAFLSKPIDPNELLALIVNLTARKTD